jgi:spermidine/putrescine transport system permease protein
MTPLRRRLVPYFLMFPGTFWLVVFFVVPMYYMVRLSLDSGTLETGFRFSWEWSNYKDALSLYDSQFLRSF